MGKGNFYAITTPIPLTDFMKLDRALRDIYAQSKFHFDFDTTTKVVWANIQFATICFFVITAQCIVIGHDCFWRAGDVCGWVCGWVCYHDNSKLRAWIFTKVRL